ncbi:ankyrin repeat-containing protein [Carex littledalei]|uniref:Ankyrin repeat-containing protein n=1 Tax=Carex littledalei TaxID=544730 RepID=A0A833QZ19_9POAL|nr:ankyrin repeat-containing protein [Carex littledalei]
MDPRLRQLLKACNKGDFSLCNSLVLADPDILLSTTPHKNNCLHIATMLGHHEFAREVWSRAPSLFSGTNVDGETPLIAALMAANLSLASDIVTAATQKCNPELLRSLLTHAEQDYTAVDVNGNHAVNYVYEQEDSWKTLKWVMNES